MASEGTQVALPSKTVNQLVPSLTVIVGKGKVEVPLTAEDNLLLSQVRVAQLRQVMDKQIELMKGTTVPLNPLALKAVVDSFEKIETMGRFAYAAALDEADGGERAGKAAAQVAKAMAEGFAKAGHQAVAEAKEDKMKKILELGKPKKLAQIEVVVEPPKTEEW